MNIKLYVSQKKYQCSISFYFFFISPPNFSFISEILSLRKIFYALLFIVFSSTAQESNNLLSLYTHVHTYTHTNHLSSLCFHTVNNEIENYSL